MKYVFILLRFYLMLGPAFYPKISRQLLCSLCVWEKQSGQSMGCTKIPAQGRITGGGGGGKGWRQKNKHKRSYNHLNQTLAAKIAKIFIFAGGGEDIPGLVIFCLDVIGLFFEGEPCET